MPINVHNHTFFIQIWNLSMHAISVKLSQILFHFEIQWPGNGRTGSPAIWMWPHNLICKTDSGPLAKRCTNQSDKMSLQWVYCLKKSYLLVCFRPSFSTGMKWEDKSRTFLSCTQLLQYFCNCLHAKIGTWNTITKTWNSCTKSLNQVCKHS